MFDFTMQQLGIFGETLRKTEQNVLLSADSQQKIIELPTVPIHRYILPKWHNVESQPYLQPSLLYRPVFWQDINNRFHLPIIITPGILLLIIYYYIIFTRSQSVCVWLTTKDTFVFFWHFSEVFSFLLFAVL